MANSANTKPIAVSPFKAAYIGGKNEKSTPSILTPKRTATARGITIDNPRILQID